MNDGFGEEEAGAVFSFCSFLFFFFFFFQDWRGGGDAVLLIIWHDQLLLSNGLWR